MKTGIFITTLAVLFLTGAAPAQTWDGGGADNNFNTALNWNTNAVPVNNGTANLIFAGAVDPSPLVNVNFDVSGVTFNNTAAAFTINASGGSVLTIRGGGITNNDADLQTFATPVTFAAGSSITATSGNLNFTGQFALNNTVTVSGAFDTSLDAIVGSGAFVKNGIGALSISPVGNQNYGLTINAGTVSYAASATFLGSTAAISVAGGTFSPLSNLTLSNGATLDVAGTGTFTFPASRTMIVQSASTATLASTLTTSASAIYRTTGTSSAFTTGGLIVTGGAMVEVLSGGAFTTTAPLLLGTTGTAGTILVDGITSRFTNNPGSSATVGIGPGSTGTLSFNNGGTGSFLNTSLTLAGSGSSGTLIVKGGAEVTAGTFEVAQVTTSGTANVLVSGPGSRLTATFNVADFSIGATSGSTGTVTVEDGGLISLAGPLTINETGTLNINGGIVTMALTEAFTNHGTLNFTSGRFTLGDDLGVGAGTSHFGANVTLPTGKEIVVPSSRTTTIGPAASIVIDGGIFSTGTLVNSGGTLDFRRGALRLTGSGAVSIGTSGPLGANVNVPSGSTLSISSSDLSVASNGLLTVAGGTFSSNNFTNNGTVRIQAGSASMASFTNNAGAQAIVEGNLSVTGSITNANGARLEFAGGTGRLLGSGNVQNNGLLLGDGTITNSVTNTSTGKIRVDPGKTLFFTGAFSPNAGQLNLQGGTLDFTGAITNSATGFISGRGALYTAGLTNNGQMAFSGGTTDIFGDVSLTAGSRIVTSGAGSVTTFWDDVVHNGTEVFTGVNCSTVFYGGQSGGGSFTGSGTIYFIGDLRPGSSPAAINYAPQVVFTPSSVLTLEVGGLAPGTQHDKLTFTHAGTPQVEWDGTLNIELTDGFTPAAGQSFDVFDFDAARDAGTFFSINVVDHGLLPAGLAFNYDELYTTGVIRVISTTGVTFAQWAAASGISGATPGGNHDGDAYDNAMEFTLGLFPPAPGTIEPNGGLFPYVDGERLRVLFSRPLDRTGVTLKVQASSDLVTWDDLAVSVNSAPFTGAGFVSENRAHPLSEPGLVEVRDVVTTPAGARRYVRIQVTLSP